MTLTVAAGGLWSGHLMRFLVGWGQYGVFFCCGNLTFSVYVAMLPPNALWLHVAFVNQIGSRAYRLYIIEFKP